MERVEGSVKNIHRIILFLVLIGVVLGGRLLPHPPNWTPCVAMALFAGFFFSNRLTAILTIVVAMLISDFIIGTYNIWLMVVIYGGLCFPILLRSLVRFRLTPLRIGFSSLIGSIVFFISSNLAVWFFTPMYTKTFSGIIACYINALPFFKNTLAGDLVWSTVIFGSYSVVCYTTKQPLAYARKAA